MSATESGQLGQSGWTPETLLAHFTASLGTVSDRLDEMADADPTQNVLTLVAGEVKRLNDLRSAEMRRQDDLRIAEGRRVDEEMACIKEIAAIRSSYEEKLVIAEAKRIDANRAGDASAVAVASERANAQATVLATQVQTSAETLRALVTQTADAIAKASGEMNRQAETRLAALEKVQAEAAGRGTVANPQIDALVATVAGLAALQQNQTGKGAGINAAWVGLLGAVGLIATALSIYAAVKP